MSHLIDSRTEENHIRNNTENITRKNMKTCQFYNEKTRAHNMTNKHKKETKEIKCLTKQRNCYLEKPQIQEQMCRRVECITSVRFAKQYKYSWHSGICCQWLS